MGEPAISVELSCLECHARAEGQLSADEFRELSQTWKLSRKCQTCRKTTSWGFAEPEVEDEEQMDFWDWLANTGVYFEQGQAGVQDERRKEPRLGLRVPLRIAPASGDEEALVSENLSKSGLCYASARNYSVGETIRITLQPEGSLSPQTRNGTIVRLTKAEDGRNLYGVRLEG